MTKRSDRKTPRIPILSGRLLSKTEAQSLIGGAATRYVYVLTRSDGTPFYVGQGIGNRVFQHEAEARIPDRLSHKLNVIRAILGRGDSIFYYIERSFANDAAALVRERELIRLFGRHDLGSGPLTNQTDGGEEGGNFSEALLLKRKQNLGGLDAEDEERRVANRFFHDLCTVESVPIKPLSKFKPERLHANRVKFRMSHRQAAALVASAIANRVLLEPGAVIPRLLEVGGIPMAIENGVGRDMLSSKMVEVADPTPGAERLRLTQDGFECILASLDRRRLIDAGILNPEPT